MMSTERVRPYQKIRHPIDDPEQSELYDFETEMPLCHHCCDDAETVPPTSTDGPTMEPGETCSRCGYTRE